MVTLDYVTPLTEEGVGILVGAADGTVVEVESCQKHTGLPADSVCESPSEMAQWTPREKS